MSLIASIIAGIAGICGVLTGNIAEGSLFFIISVLWKIADILEKKHDI